MIITSATIDPDRFARHFAGPDGRPAPVIEVSGRTFPVEIRYRPPRVEHGDRVVDVDPLDALADAVAELLAEGEGDVLVFLSGDREIRDAEEVLRGRRFPGTEIFPLFARLTAAEQQRAFRRHSTRRVVLSTNIAETSVTVPGIRYVVDTGVARISRYSTRTKVQRLPIEPISQASAAQRAGRCGRVADGICIRLYSEDDFDGRPEFTDPEIQRTNLASVILSMADLDLGPVDDFPFVDPPDRKAVRDGMSVLTELGALRIDDDQRPRLTRVGRDMASLPLDPRLARMVVEGHRNGALPDVLVVVAALTVQDVRERPAEEREKADQFHRRFADKSSDFLGYLNLWRYLTEQRRELSGSAFRKMCRAEYLHWLRIREWQDLTAQLTRLQRDHLDFHKTMESYFDAKAMLFEPDLAVRGVICTDDEWGEKLTQQTSIPIERVNTHDEVAADEAEWRVSFHNLNKVDAGTDLEIATPHGVATMHCPLPGIINVQNQMVALAVVTGLGIPVQEAATALSSTPQVPGRMEVIAKRSEDTPLVIVDFAHTPDAMQSACNALDPVTPGRLWCLFGATGDRDRGKRPIMAQAAAQSSDVVILTDDDIYTEDPAAIRAEVATGFTDAEMRAVQLWEDDSRAHAIHAAVLGASAQDTILIAGRGHETIQMIGDDPHPLDDRFEAREAVKMREQAEPVDLEIWDSPLGDVPKLRNIPKTWQDLKHHDTTTSR